MLGAAEITASVTKQWQNTHSKHQKLLFPILTRIDESEKEKLEQARKAARTIFASFPQHLSSREQEQYWGNVELPYIPWYNYEEVPSLFRENLKLQRSLLASIESFVSYLTKGEISEFVALKEGQRQQVLAQFIRSGKNTADQTTPKI